MALANMAQSSHLLLRRIPVNQAVAPLYQYLQRPLLAASISINIPGFLSDIWEGILKAVPKKKTSHMKKRHRQLAGKALKDVTAVVNCPGCGQPKRTHLLCPHCLQRQYLGSERLITILIVLQRSAKVSRMFKHTFRPHEFYCSPTELTYIKLVKALPLCVSVGQPAAEQC